MPVSPLPAPGARLLVFFARIGDLVMLTPLMRQLAGEGPLELLSRPWARDLLGEQTWLGTIHALRKPNLRGAYDLLTGGRRQRMGSVLAAHDYDEIVLMDAESPRIRKWIDSWRGSAKLRVIPLKRARKGQMSDVYRSAAIDAGIRGDQFEPAPRLDVEPTRFARAREQISRLGRRVLAIQAGSSLTHRWIRKRPNLKGLRAAQWADLLSRLLVDGDADAAVLHGSAPERREARAIMSALPMTARRHVHDWTGQVLLADLPAVLAASMATISVDTGPAHIAASVGCPLLVVFGPTDPSVYLPRASAPVEMLLGRAACQFCHETALFKTCRDNICLSSMSSETIHAAWRRLSARISMAQTSTVSRVHSKASAVP